MPPNWWIERDRKFLASEAAEDFAGEIAREGCERIVLAASGCEYVHQVRIEAADFGAGFSDVEAAELGWRPVHSVWWAHRLVFDRSGYVWCRAPALRAAIEQLADDPADCVIRGPFLV